MPARAHTCAWQIRQRTALLPTLGAYASTARYAKNLVTRWQTIWSTFCRPRLGATWGDLVRRADLDAAVTRLDQKIDALGARLDQRIDGLEVRIGAIERMLGEIKNDLRSLGNPKRTIVVTGMSMAVSIILGLGAIGVAFLQVATRTGG